MSVINDFWNWVINATSSALNMLNTMFNSSIMQPFFLLFIVVFSTMVIFKFIVKPLIGGSGSDKVKNKKDEDED